MWPAHRGSHSGLLFACALCLALLVYDFVLQRLGCGKAAAADIKSHPWFAGLDWDKVEQCDFVE